MSWKSLFGVAGFICVAVTGTPGCSLLFQAADPVDNVNFDGCFRRVIDNPDGTRQRIDLRLIAGVKPGVDGEFAVIEIAPGQGVLSREDYALAGAATRKGDDTTDGEAKLTASPTMGTPGAPQEITVTRNLPSDNARVEMSEADGRSFDALLAISCQGMPE